MLIYCYSDFITSGCKMHYRCNYTDVPALSTPLVIFWIQIFKLIKKLTNLRIMTINQLLQL